MPEVPDPGEQHRQPVFVARGDGIRVPLRAPRLNDGRHFKATLVGIRDSAMLMQPRTRVPVPIQAVPYGDVLRMERTKAGIGAGKAIAIGAATGAGAFFGILAIMLSIVSD